MAPFAPTASIRLSTPKNSWSAKGLFIPKSRGLNRRDRTFASCSDLPKKGVRARTRGCFDQKNHRLFLRWRKSSSGRVFKRPTPERRLPLTQSFHQPAGFSVLSRAQLRTGYEARFHSDPE